jgi:Heparinase II/III-like protein
VLDLSEEELLRRIPDRSGFQFVGCPNCTGGTQEGQLTWTLDRPDEVACRYCKMRFPNENYPENQVVRVKNPRGEVQEYPCWESPEPPPRPGRSTRRDGPPREGYRYFFRARAWFLARESFSRAAVDLALLYHQTGDRAAARRAALILDRFAQVYPGYCVHYDYPFTQKRIFPGDATHPFPVPDFRAARWSWWAYMDIPEDLIRAYDLIRASGAVDDRMRRRIEDEFFRASVTFVRGFKPLYSNMDPTLLRGMIVAGRVLGDPDDVHEAVGRIEQLVARQFFADGMWREGSTSYHRQTVGGLLSLAGLLEDYSDPPGYHHPRDGAHYEHLDLSRRFPILEKAREVPARLRYPNGRTLPVHDAWARERDGSPTTETGPLLFPAFGQARLGRGRGDDQLQVHLHFAGGYGHEHADLLSLTLFARGHERLSDLGYTHTRYRAWSLATLAHNTVMVDGRDQDTGSESRPSDGNLQLYVPGDATFQAVEASAPRAYPGLTRDYRRMLILIGVGPDRAYVVDLFRVQGGTRHEYALLGDADHDGTLEAHLPWSRAGATLLPTGVSVKLPTGESVAGEAGGHNIAYAFVRDVETARPSRPWVARFTSEATPRGSVRVHRLPEPATEVFRARAPSLRRALADDALVDRDTLPMLVERREGADLSSTFLSVLEPYAEQPFLKAVERLPLNDARPGDVGLKIAWDGGTDTLLIPGEAAGAILRSGDLVMQGRIGFVRERAGEVERMTLVGGTRLEKGSQTLTGQGLVRGEILGVLRKARGDAVDGLVVAASLPAPEVIQGRTVVLSDTAGFTHGHEVAGVSAHDGHPVLVLATDPAFEFRPDGTSRLCFFPGRSWSGPNRFVIAAVTTWSKTPTGR